MASTIEPCESKPAGLAALSSTLDMFDTFKSSQDEDRDSDEDSFHLPMLGCDDDMDISNKETSGMATPNPETEDDILNKFETTATPDIDPKLEDIILDDDTDDTCEKGSTKFNKISNQIENKDGENSYVSTECVDEMKIDENETGTGFNERTTETRRLSEEIVDTKVASETDENTDGSELFKDLEVVDELNESFEEKGGEKTNNEIGDNGKKTIIEINIEPESMEVETVEVEEKSSVENILDIVKTGEAQENVICDLKETEDTSITKTKLYKNESTAKTVTEMASAIESSYSESIILPGDSIVNDDLSGTDKSTLDVMIDKNMVRENLSQIENRQQENRVDNSNEESEMACDDEEDEIINDIVKEVNEKLDSDDDEMMAESSDLQDCSTKIITSTNIPVGSGNNDKMENCAELEEIISSSCLNTADNNLVEKQDTVAQKSLDQDEDLQDIELSKTEAFVPISEYSKTILDSAEDLHEGVDKNNKINEENDDAKPMDIDISMDEEDNIPVSSSKEQENASGENTGEKSESRIIELSTSITAKIVESTPTTDIVESTHTAKIVENTPTTKIVDSTSTAEIVESAPSAEILESSTIAEIVESTPTADIVESTPSAEIVESTPTAPTAEIVESTSTAEIVETTPTAEIVESTSTAEIEESAPSAEIVENTPTAEIVESTPTTEIVESTPTARIVESMPTAEIVESTPTAEIVEDQFFAQTECTESVPPIKSVVSNACENEKTETSKIENSYESTNSLECDDLLDVSIIRDVDEDNATAIAENSNDIQSSEKSDNDDQDDDKADNEMDESEPDQDDILLSSDKDYHIDSEEGNSNSCDQDTTTVDNVISENTSDGETKGDDDVVMKETEEPKNSSSSRRMEHEIESTSEKADFEEKSVELGNQDKIKENGLQLGKRPFTDTCTEENQGTSKKLRLSPESNYEEKGKTSVKNSQMKTLLSFEKFMQDRKFGGKKLTRSDLEQFCLQKICEAIVHRTDVGELHQTVKKQEIIIENLRKDLQQLTKQTRDLDIVNKKLMNELKIQNGNKKPLVPLKITRSVGLQVKLNIGLEPAVRRKQPIVATTPSRTPSTSTISTTNTPINRSRNITPANSGVVRQVNQNSTPVTTTTPSPRKPQPTTPILSQALQTRQTPPLAKRTPIRPKPVEPAKPSNPGVIDLTDEDDKTSKTVGTVMKIPNKPTTPKTNIVQNKNLANKTVNSQASKVAGQASKVAGQASKVAGQANKVMNKANKTQNNQNKPVTMAQVKAVGSKTGTQTRTVTTLPQGVRLTSTQLKNGLTIPANVVTSNASGTTQFMYVVQPSSLVTSTAGGTQKAVLLNFQPTNNGVLASTINGSAVSVIPSKTPNTVQLKSIPPRKHPASLPLPPSVPQNPSLKPLLPKPHLSIRKTDTGIILQWRMPYNLDIYEGIASYQLFAYQETNAPPSTDMWRKVGDVKALALPMACTLTQFADKNKYYFAVRSVDVHKRIGAFSDPEEISL